MTFLEILVGISTQTLHFNPFSRSFKGRSLIATCPLLVTPEKQSVGTDAEVYLDVVGGFVRGVIVRFLQIPFRAHLNAA